jgi:SAM-dependent methyltransferase
VNELVRECAFDELAGSYDASFTDTPVGRALREIVWTRMERLFRRGHRVLELGCGTGEDAVCLAERGVRVVATDPSSRMLQIARAKATAHRCGTRIEFRCHGMQDLDAFSEGERFDGVLSNFGAVNCVADLPALLSSLAAQLVPGAPLLFVVMGRMAPWEWLWYLPRGQAGKAWRRLTPGGVHWRGMTISYPTPSEMERALAIHFEVTRVAPLGFVLPPSYAAAWLDHSPGMLKILARLESWAQRSRLLASWSDHFIIEARKKPSPESHSPASARA